MKKLLPFIFVVVALFPAHAQLTPERLAQDKYLANGVHHSYDPGVITDTPAPEGTSLFTSAMSAGTEAATTWERAKTSSSSPTFSPRPGSRGF